MYIVSSRKDFWNSDKLSKLDTDIIRDVSLEDEDWDGKENITRSDFENIVRNKKVLILCHGYNNESKDALSAYKEIAHYESNYTKHFDVIIGYIWPGGDKVLEYLAASSRVDDVAPRFAELLKSTMSSCSKLAVMSHSLGCRVSLAACNQLDSFKDYECKKFFHYMMAAAVDNDSVEGGKKQYENHYQATLFGTHTYIFHSKKDKILDWGYDYFEKFRIKYWERENRDKIIALGSTGPKNKKRIHKNTKVINCKKAVRLHGDYKRTPAIYKYIRDELNSKPAEQFSALA